MEAPHTSRAIRDGPGILGIDDVARLPWLFKEFARHWYEHHQPDRLPPLTILHRRDAPPMTASGVVFETCQADGGPEFRVRFAGEAFEYYFKRKLPGMALADLLTAQAADAMRRRYMAIIERGLPSYSNRRRSWVYDRELVWVERIYAPFADDNGTPAYVAGLCKLSYS